MPRSERVRSAGEGDFYSASTAVMMMMMMMEEVGCKHAKTAQKTLLDYFDCHRPIPPILEYTPIFASWAV